MDTEEPARAAKLEAATRPRATPEEAVAHIEALNNLGVVWCNRGETEKAHELLEAPSLRTPT